LDWHPIDAPRAAKRAEKGRAAARLRAARLYNRCFILFTSEYHAS
jgi:hypothetical protein